MVGMGKCTTAIKVGTLQHEKKLQPNFEASNDICQGLTLLKMKLRIFSLVESLVILYLYINPCFHTYFTYV